MRETNTYCAPAVSQACINTPLLSPVTREPSTLLQPSCGDLPAPRSRGRGELGLLLEPAACAVRSGPSTWDAPGRTWRLTVDVFFCPVPVSWGTGARKVSGAGSPPLGPGLVCQPCLSLDSRSNDTSVLVSRQQRIKRHRRPDPDKFTTGRPHPCPDPDQVPHGQPRSPSSPNGPGKPWLLLPSGGSLR